MTESGPVERACWCGAMHAHPVASITSGRMLIECDGCGVVILHPPPSDEELAQAYSAEYYGSSRRKFIAPVAALVGAFQGGRARRLAKLVPRGGRVLDVGCGNGGFLQQLHRRGYRVEGTEWTDASAARALGDGSMPIHVGDLVELDLPAASFDAITLWHVFEHLRQPRETLLKARALLKPGGALVMSMPNAESAQARRYAGNWFHHDPPRHLFGFGPHALTLLLEEVGFRVTRMHTWSFEQNPFGEIQSAMNQRQSRVGGQRDRLYHQLKGLSREPAGVRLKDLASMLALAPMALMRDVIDSLRGEGATVTIEAACETQSTAAHGPSTG